MVQTEEGLGYLFAASEQAVNCTLPVGVEVGGGPANYLIRNG